MEKEKIETVDLEMSEEDRIEKELEQKEVKRELMDFIEIIEIN